MIFTNDFMMINFPKMGSTFTRQVIWQAYSNRERRFHRRVLYKARIGKWPVQERKCFNPIRGYVDQHSRVEQISEGTATSPESALLAIRSREYYHRTITFCMFRPRIIFPRLTSS